MPFIHKVFYLVSCNKWVIDEWINIGASYTGPLLNVYRPAYPESWYNNGKGGFRINRSGNRTTVTAYSGERTLKVGEDLIFDFALLITPVKKVNSRSQFTDRYYQNEAAPTPGEENLKVGMKIIPRNSQ